jgi:hypothetical protein
MTRIRLGVLSLLAVFAVFALAAASASANDACTEGTGTEIDICAERPGFTAEEFGSPTPHNLGNPDATAVVSKLKTTIATVGVEIECTKASFTDTVEDSSVSKGEVTFSVCKVNKPAKGCEVVEPISFKFTDELPAKHADEGSRIGVEFWGQNGGPTKETEEFVTITLKDKAPETCIVIATHPEESFKVSGSQWCTIDSSNTIATTHQEHHEVICTGKGSTGSELKFGVAEAEFVATFKEVEPFEAMKDSEWENWWIHESV